MRRTDRPRRRQQRAEPRERQAVAGRPEGDLTARSVTTGSEKSASDAMLAAPPARSRRICRRGASLSRDFRQNGVGCWRCRPFAPNISYHVPFALPPRLRPCRRLHRALAPWPIPPPMRPRSCAWRETCAADGVALAVFPELSVSGYAIDDLLCRTRADRHRAALSP